MKRKLEMDDIREGMFITVLKGKTERRMLPGPNGPAMSYRERDHYNGKVLEVIALEMPYIVVRVHEARGVRNDSLDIRNIEVMALTPGYVHSLLPNLEISKDSFWEKVTDASLENADVTIEEIFKDL